MTGKLQEAKGKAETAIGNVTGSEKLQRKGEIDQAAGQLKQAVSKTKRKTNKAITKAAKEIKKGE